MRDGNSGLVTDFRGHNLVCMYVFLVIYISTELNITVSREVSFFLR